MVSQAKIRSNRQNAQRSTGPKTQKGKEIVAQNALKHGLSALPSLPYAHRTPLPSAHRTQLIRGQITPSPKPSVQTALYKYIRIRLYAIRAFAPI